MVLLAIIHTLQTVIACFGGHVQADDGPMAIVQCALPRRQSTAHRIPKQEQQQ